MRAFATAAFSAALMLSAPLVVRAMASTIGPGAIASFNYASKLVELPVAILITSISTVALARLSVLHAQGQHAELTRALLRDTQYALLVATGVAVLGYWFADSVVQLIFGRGQMDDAALARVASLTRIALLSVPLMALASMATAHLNATRQTARIVGPTVASLLLLPLMAAPGMAWSSEPALMAAVVGFHACVAFSLARRAGFGLTGPLAIVTPASLPFLGAVAGAAALAAAIDAGLGLQSHWLRLLLAGAGFGLAFFAARRFLRSAQLPTFLATP